jgi:hypothetical protein
MESSYYAGQAKQNHDWQSRAKEEMQNRSTVYERSAISDHSYTGAVGTAGIRMGRLGWVYTSLSSRPE